jgi:hypothetical protein
MNREITKGQVIGWSIPVVVTMAGAMLTAYMNVRTTLSAHGVRMEALEQRMEVLHEIERQLHNIDARTIRIEAVLEEKDKQRQSELSGGGRRR